MGCVMLVLGNLLADLLLAWSDPRIRLEEAD
jgi:peptide/nickel transport system permease protein